MILAKNRTSSRLFSFFTDSIQYVDELLSNKKFTKIIVPSNDWNIKSFINNIDDSSIIFVDFVTESGNFYSSSVEIRDGIKKELPNSEVICISDVIGGDLKSFAEKNNLKILNSPFLSFYGFLGFTEDSFSLFVNNQFSLLKDFRFTPKRNHLFTSRNGRFNSHRAYTIYKLFKEELNDNLITALFYQDISFDSSLENVDTEYLQKIDKDFYQTEISPKIPITIDNLVSWEDGGYDLKGDMHHNFDFFDSYIDLVTENVCNTPNNEYQLVTMTEKSIKPLLYYQIPLYITQQNHAKYLKQLGFDLFEDVFPIDYDSKSDVDRIDYVISLIKEKQNFDLETFFKENKHRFLNNRNLCIKYAFSNGVDSILNLIKKYEII